MAEVLCQTILINNFIIHSCMFSIQTSSKSLRFKKKLSYEVCKLMDAVVYTYTNETNSGKGNMRKEKKFTKNRNLLKMAVFTATPS